jgi:hypothetical protein
VTHTTLPDFGTGEYLPERPITPERFDRSRTACSAAG